MHSRNGSIRFSASDLANHLACRHLTRLDQMTAERRLQPPTWKDPLLEVLQQRGFDHEKAYLEHLQRERKLEIVRVAAVDREGEGRAFERTQAAMQAGADVIVQAVLEHDRWYGRADVLLKAPTPSKLGSWSYEVADTKLARDTRAGTILQLCLYSYIVGEIQGLLPQRMHVVAPGTGFEPETYRLEDYLAYSRFVKSRLEASLPIAGGEGEGPPSYPEPTLQCDICRWWPRCDTQRRNDDHLCLVAGMGRMQQRELQSWGVERLRDLAGLPLPISRRPRRGSRDTYERLREQARLQLEARLQGEPGYELLSPIEPGRGLARLPQPSWGDVFLDLEGDPFAGTGGQDYLFGYVTIAEDGVRTSPQYVGLWALDPTDERARFESLMQVILDRWERDPGMHIYHYAPYEPAAFKRLMGRYGTQEDAMDRLLRAERFVDLHAVVKRALRAGVEKYSIKDLEPLYRFQRKVELRQASACLRSLEYALELGDHEAIAESLRDQVQAYNRDDCLSTWGLRDWLEALRLQAIENGQEVPRPELKVGDAGEALDARRQRVQFLKEKLTRDVPALVEARSQEQQAQWLLAQMLEWHRREAKAPWWEYYRLLELPEEELLEERMALAGLEFVCRLHEAKGIPTDRYHYPPQETQITRHSEVRSSDGVPFGKVVAIEVVERTVDILKKKKTAALHPQAVFEHQVFQTQVQEEALQRLGDWVVENGIDGNGAYRAARDLLLRHPPRVHGSSEQLPLRFDTTPLQRDNEPTLEAAKRLGCALASGVLPIQGPPGSGKTYAGARMIVELVRQGKKVGVTAVSHAVIRNLLNGVEGAAHEAGLPVRAIHKDGKDTTNEETETIRITDDNATVEEALRTCAVHVAGGTSWLWARPEFFESVDVLVVDEAGQMSLANVLAVAQAARNLVLIGDPQQLEQPQKGTHPDGAEVSALEHLIGTEAPRTIPPDRGLFLAETWRLHPDLCAFTSEQFYEGRLRSHAGLDLQRIAGCSVFTGAGLGFVPVEHEGNRSSSLEEVEAVAGLVEAIVAPGASWVDAVGTERPLRLENVLIVAPYNAQVAAILERLPGAKVGTVDKFQGQQAPVVIYSMTTSTADEAPRGMEFLYSLNRLNVATSRARCACILVANPKLLEPECRTPRQIRLANAFCRYLELAADGTAIVRHI